MTIFTKYKLKIGILLMTGALCMAPGTSRAQNDNAVPIVSQERQVFESWETGDPYGKYFLGVQNQFCVLNSVGMLSE